MRTEATYKSMYDTKLFTDLHRIESRNRVAPIKKDSLLPFTFSLLTAAVTLILGLESYLQAFHPEQCILTLLHSHGYLTQYSVIYQPNRGIWHLMGWAGTFLMLIMHGYSLRKKVGFMHEWGMLKHWMDFHIFCGILGPVLITYHATFRVAGIISISYWSVVTVALSGLFGRFVLGFLPRGIAGNELEIDELELMNDHISYKVMTFYRRAQSLSSFMDANISYATWEDKKIIPSFLNLVKNTWISYVALKRLNWFLKRRIKLLKKDRQEFINVVRQKMILDRRIHFLKSAHRLFQYWHKFHIVFTVLIYLGAFIHIIIYFLFRIQA